MKGGQGRRIPESKYWEMYDAYLENQSYEYVAQVTGVNIGTVRKYFLKGDPRRSMPPLGMLYREFQRGALKRAEERTRDVLRRRNIQTRTMTNALWSAFLEENEDGSQTFVVPDAWKESPTGWKMLVQFELALRNAKKEQDERDKAENAVRFMWDNPVHRNALKRQLQKTMAQVAGGTVRELMNILDPDGSKGMIELLPLGLQIVALTDPDDPSHQQQVQSLLARLRKGGLAAPIEIDTVEEPEHDEATVGEEV